MPGLMARIMQRVHSKDTTGKEFLKKIPILSGLANGELELVWSIVKKRDVASGQVIVRDGEIGDSMYFFAQGVADVTKNLTMKLGQSGFGEVEKSINLLLIEDLAKIL